MGDLLAPEELQKRLELAAEALRVAEEANDGERVFDAQLMTCINLIDAGAIAEAEAEIEAVARRANELRQPSHTWASWALRSSLALLQGEFDRAEEFTEMEVRPGLPTNPVRDDVSANRFHMFLLARERGRVDDIEATVRASVQEFPWYPLHQSALACLLVDVGRAKEARAVFAELTREDFAVFHRDSAWLLGMALASEALRRGAPAHWTGTSDFSRRSLAASRRPRSTLTTRSPVTSEWEHGRGWPTPSTTSLGCS